MKKLLLIQLAIIVPLSSFASDEFAEASEAVHGLYEDIAVFVMTILLLLFLFSLAKLILAVINGEEDSVRKLMWWLIAFAAGFVVIGLLVKLV